METTQTKPTWTKTWTKYRLRTCASLHSCAYCQTDIRLGQRYFDGGYGKRVHEDCGKEACSTRAWNAPPEGYVVLGRSLTVEEKQILNRVISLAEQAAKEVSPKCSAGTLRGDGSVVMDRAGLEDFSRRCIKVALEWL